MYTCVRIYGEWARTRVPWNILGGGGDRVVNRTMQGEYDYINNM